VVRGVVVVHLACFRQQVLVEMFPTGHILIILSATAEGQPQLSGDVSSASDSSNSDDNFLHHTSGIK
jgi:hypothetical protein